MEKPNIDIERMSRETGISVLEIERALGVASSGAESDTERAIVAATTVSEAKRIYWEIPFDERTGKDSYIGKKALERWNALCLVAIREAQTVEAIRELYNGAPGGSQSQSEGLWKWEELSTKAIEGASSREAIEKVLGLIPQSIQGKAREKLSVLSVAADTERISRATSASDAKGAYFTVSDPGLKRKALERWLAIAQTKAETLEAYRETGSGSPLAAEAIKKLAAFFS